MKTVFHFGLLGCFFSLSYEEEEEANEEEE